MKNQSAVEIEKLNRVKKAKNKRNEGKSKPSPKRACLWIIQQEQVEQQVTPPTNS